MRIHAALTNQSIPAAPKKTQIIKRKANREKTQNFMHFGAYLSDQQQQQRNAVHRFRSWKYEKWAIVGEERPTHNTKTVK